MVTTHSIRKHWEIPNSLSINTKTARSPQLKSFPHFQLKYSKLQPLTSSSLDPFKIIVLGSFQRRPWVSVCPQLFKLRRSSNCNLFLPEVSYPYQQQQQRCQKATLQFMLEKLKRSDLCFQYLTWTILHSRNCWVVLRKNSASIIQWVVSQSHARKMLSFISLLSYIQYEWWKSWELGK